MGHLLFFCFEEKREKTGVLFCNCPSFCRKLKKIHFLRQKAPCLFAKTNKTNRKTNGKRTKTNEKTEKKGKKAENGLVWTENLPDFFKKGLCLDGRFFCYTIDEI